MQQFSVLIPTLNEAGNIQPLLQRIQRMAEQHGINPEIVFIDDGSGDGTREQIRAYPGPLQVKLLERDKERGLTGAVVAGARAACYDWVVVMDSDMSHPPESIPAMLEPLAAGSHDMIIGSRYAEGGGTPGWPASRRVASLIASLPARLLTGVRDPLAGFFAVHKKYLTVVEHDLSGFKVGLEVIAKAGKGFRVGEVPISFQDRSTGQSKMKLSILAQYLRQLVRLSLNTPTVRNSPILMVTAILAGLADASLFTFLNYLGCSLDTSHIFSFLIATCFGYFLTPMLSHGRVYSASITGLFRFATVILLLLCLRGGVLALPAMQFSSPPLLLIIVLGITTSLSLPAALLISRLRPQREHINWYLFGSLLIGYTILLRLVYMGSIELIQEEAYYWNYAQHLAPGYLDHPPMVALLIHLGTLLFGNTELGVRFGSFACWFITAFYAYRLTQTIFNSDAAFRAVVLVAVLPIFFGVALVITPDAPLIACWSGALYYLYHALVKEQRQAWYLAGIWLGLGLASKYTIAFLGPAIVIFMLLDPNSRKWFIRPQPYLAALLAAAIFSPVIWWNYQHDWASFLFQSQGRLQQARDFSTDELLGSILILLTPTGFLAALHTVRPRLARLEFCIAGPGDINHRSYLFGMTMVIIPLAIFTIFSLNSEIKLNWTGPLWLALLPFMAWTMVSQRNKPRWLVTRLWPGTMVILVACYGTVLHYCAIGLPGLSYGSGDFLFAYDNLAQQVEQQVQIIAAQENERPLVAGMDRYKIASGLAFYRNKQRREELTIVDETIGRNLFDHNALMYNYWYPPALASAKNILVISGKKEQLAPANFNDHYQQLGEIGEITLTKQGKKAGSYYYRLLTWYTPHVEKGHLSSYTPPRASAHLQNRSSHDETAAVPDAKGTIL